MASEPIEGAPGWKRVSYIHGRPNVMAQGPRTIVSAEDDGIEIEREVAVPYDGHTLFGGATWATIKLPDAVLAALGYVRQPAPDREGSDGR